MITKEEVQQIADQTGKIKCPACDGKELIVMGLLAWRAWISCRACGWRFYKNIERGKNEIN